MVFDPLGRLVFEGAAKDGAAVVGGGILSLTEASLIQSRMGQVGGSLGHSYK